MKPPRSYRVTLALGRAVKVGTTRIQLYRLTAYVATFRVGRARRLVQVPEGYAAVVARGIEVRYLRGPMPGGSRAELAIACAGMTVHKLRPRAEGVGT